MPGIRSAILYSVISKYSIHLLGLLSTMVLARLLTPTEIGTFAISSSIAILLSEFRMLGAGDYLIREKILDKQKIRSAIGLTILISWGLGLSIVISSSIIAKFYRMPEITVLFLVLSINFFIAPYISIPTALLLRELKNRQLMIIQLTASIANFISTITLVLLGFSFYSLAWGRCIASTVQLAMTLYYRPKDIPWLPSFKRMSDVAKFGIYMSATNILKRSQITVPDLIIGKMGNPAQVGIFSRGMGLVVFIFQSIVMGISPVALPYLSGVKRQGGDVLKAYTKATSLIGSLTWPVLAVASLTSTPAIRLFFGDQWDEAAPIAAILAYWALFLAVHVLSPQLLISTGKEVWMVIKEAIVFIAFVGGIILSFPYGLEAVAWSLVFSSTVNLILTTWVLKHATGLSALYFYRAMTPNIILTTVCWLTTYTIDQIVDFDSTAPFVSIGLVAFILPPVWLATIIILKHDIHDELKNILKQSKKSIA